MVQSWIDLPVAVLYGLVVWFCCVHYNINTYIIIYIYVCVYICHCDLSPCCSAQSLQLQMLQGMMCKSCSSVRSCQDWHQSLQKKGQIALCLCRTCWRPWPYFFWPENFGSSWTMLNCATLVQRPGRETSGESSTFWKAAEGRSLVLRQWSCWRKVCPFPEAFPVPSLLHFCELTSDLMEHDGIDAGWLAFHHWSAAAFFGSRAHE